MTTPDNLVPNFYTEHGTLVKCPPEGGKTDGNDLRHAAQAAKDMTLEDLMEHTEHGPVFARHMRYLRQLYTNHNNQAGVQALRSQYANA